MLKNLLVSTLVALSLSSCVAIHRPSYVTPEEASGSVYKIEAHLHVIIEEDPDHEVRDFGWSGTAWVAARNSRWSYLITAGHVCETRPVIPTEGLDLDVKDITYSLIGSDNRTYTTGITVLLDDDENDVCLIAVPANLGVPIAIADHDPSYAQECYYIGAPQGLWGGGIAGYYTTRFIGRGDLWGNGKEGLFFSTSQADHGASGSPYICDGYAVAELNLGANNFPVLSSGVPWGILNSPRFAALGVY